MRNGFLTHLEHMEGGPPDVLIHAAGNTHTHGCSEDTFERRFAALGYTHFQLLVAGTAHRICGVSVISKTPFLLQTTGAAQGVEQGRAMAVIVNGVTIVNLYEPIVCVASQSSSVSWIERRAQFDEAVKTRMASNLTSAAPDWRRRFQSGSRRATGLHSL